MTQFQFCNELDPVAKSKVKKKPTFEQKKDGFKPRIRLKIRPKNRRKISYGRYKGNYHQRLDMNHTQSQVDKN